MPSDLSFLQWAFGYMRERAAADAAAPAFRQPIEEVRALSDDEVRLVRAFPEGPMDGDDLRTALTALLDDHLVNGRTPRFQNQLFSGVEEEGLVGGFLGVFQNNTMSTREVAPLPSEMETAVLDWMLRLLPWDRAKSSGTLTPAGSFSNYLAVFLARKRATAEHGDDVVPRLALFTSEAAHYSIEKGTDLAGVPLANVFRVPCDARDRMRPTDLGHALRAAEDKGLIPFFVNATLGTTVAGSLDRVDDLREAIDGRNLWLHADGAWGALGLLGSERDKFRRPLAHADSLTWDAHKGLGAPVALSFLMVKDGASLDALRPPSGAGYLFKDADAEPETADLGLRSLYCGKPFVALSMWLLWKSRGESGLREHVDHARALTLRFRDRMASSRVYELVHEEPETWTVCFRPRGPARAERERVAVRAREQINATGRFMINLCPSGGERVFRALFINPMMTEAHVDELFEHVEACHPAA